MSNNLAENSIRPFTIGRKDWLFCGSPIGAAASIAVYSIIKNAKAYGLNPYKYFYYIFSELPGALFYLTLTFNRDLNSHDHSKFINDHQGS